MVAAFLFGSQATARAVRGSDVDVAVVLDPTTRGVDSFSLRVDLSSDLAGVLHTNEVDVLVLDEAPPLLAARVLRAGCVYCRDEEALPLGFPEVLVDQLVRLPGFRNVVVDTSLKVNEARVLRTLGACPGKTPPAKGGRGGLEELGPVEEFVASLAGRLGAQT